MREEEKYQRVSLAPKDRNNSTDSFRPLPSCWNQIDGENVQ
jgi:hypothetical protein